MPAVKAKESYLSQCYRPASHYDDVTLAQKREYWRNKKRAQRARLSERREKPEQHRGTSPRLHLTIKNQSEDLQREEEQLQTRKICKVVPLLQPLPRSILTLNRNQLDSTCNPGSQSRSDPPSFCSHVKANSDFQNNPHSPAGSPVHPPAGTPECPPTLTQSEEERAAKRREHWRMKKREQRAKLSAQLAKARERMQGGEVAPQKSLAGPFTQGQVLRPAPRVSVSVPLPSEPRGGSSLQMGRVLLHKGMAVPKKGGPVSGVRGAGGDILSTGRAMSGARMPLSCKGRVMRQKGKAVPVMSGGISVKLEERKSITGPLLTNISRTLSRCTMPRIRISDAQRLFRFKLPSMVSGRKFPRILPGDSPDQITAKRREYWRVKKREQRAKLSLEMKTRLKEKDSLMRRVKRYQQILEEMRRLRSTARTSDPIGGWIKEDGSVHPRTTPLQPSSNRTNQVPVRTTPRPLCIRPHPHMSSANPAAGCSSGVRKMSVCLEPCLMEEERMARKREYWRLKKREQRAARAGAAYRKRAHKRGTAVKMNLPGSTKPGASSTDILIKAEVDPNPPTSPDRQATTLLAVASMKKLLEESLISVNSMKTEPIDHHPETDINPLFSHNLQDCYPEVQSSLQIKDPSESKETVHSSHSTIIVSMEMSHSPGSPDATPTHGCLSDQHRLHKKLGPEPGGGDPELGDWKEQGSHPRSEVVDSEVAERKDRGPQHGGPGGINLKSTGSGPELCPGPDKGGPGLSSLQRKREYWKMMKRQQRARLKTLQKDKTIQTSRCQTELPTFRPPCSDLVYLPPTNSQDPAVMHHTHKISAVERNPHTLATSRTSLVLGTGRSLGTGQNLQTLGTGRSLGTGQNLQTLGTGRSLGTGQSLQTLDLDRTTCLPTLQPPENPLFSFNLQPIESPSPPPTVSPSQTSSLVPPKLVPGESEENFVRRKREYWRLKKKEQRARKAKAGLVPGLRALRGSTAPNLQDSSQWIENPEDTRHDNSVPDEPFQYLDYTVPVEDESELFDLVQNQDSVLMQDQDGPVSDETWRKCFLMDHDSLNQLLVCMVCGELQYSHSLEGVQVHIKEAHPHTLGLDLADKEKILHAWDEQVSQRERFFTSQLQHHSGKEQAAKTT